jgi:hypothetical protein
MKLATVEAFMPELRGNCYRTGRGRASNPKAAISRAIGDVLKQVRGKRWQTIKATITVVEITLDKDTPTVVV